MCCCSLNNKLGFAKGKELVKLAISFPLAHSVFLGIWHLLGDFCEAHHCHCHPRSRHPHRYGPGRRPAVRLRTGDHRREAAERGHLRAGARGGARPPAEAEEDPARDCGPAGGQHGHGAGDREGEEPCRGSRPGQGSFRRDLRLQGQDHPGDRG